MVAWGIQRCNRDQAVDETGRGKVQRTQRNGMKEMWMRKLGWLQQ